EHPARGGEVAREHSDFANVWLRHELSLVLRRKDTLKRDAEVQHQVRLHIQMRLAAANGCHGCRDERAQALYWPVIAVRRAVGNDVARWKVGAGRRADCIRAMRML